jgi:hypothetical protein
VADSRALLGFDTPIGVMDDDLPIEIARREIARGRDGFFLGDERARKAMPISFQVHFPPAADARAHMVDASRRHGVGPRPVIERTDRACSRDSSCGFRFSRACETTAVEHVGDESRYEASCGRSFEGPRTSHPQASTGIGVGPCRRG